MIYDSIAVEDDASPELRPAVKMEEPRESSNVGEGERNDSNGSFSASETGGDVPETGGL